MNELFSIWTFVYVIAAVGAYFFITTFGSNRLSLPPGPPKSFISGNAREIPAKFKHLKFAEWSKVYGDVIHLSVFSRPLIILDSAKAASDLLGDRSAIYSSRPRSHMADMMGYSSSTLLAPYGPTFRQARKLMAFALNARVSKTYHPIQERVAQEFALSLLDNRENFRDNIKRATGSAILQIAYGYRLKDNDDPYLVLVAQATYNFGLAVSGGFWVDYLPFLKYVPLSLWVPQTRKYIIDGRSLSIRIRNELHEYVKDQMAAGKAPDSFTSMLLRAKDQGHKTGEEDEEDMIKRTSSILYGAGSDSSCAYLEVFFFLMMHYPEVQRRAQEEIDKVIGPDRLPTMQDSENLPYLAAVTKEVLRWSAPVPLAVPHALITEDEYRGMRIPKGATVIANVWSILHDEKEYERPHEFVPERFLVQELPLDPFTIAFGFGRRLCPGMEVARTTAFLSFSTTLHSFSIDNALDDSGRPIIPKVEFTSGLISHIADHPARITPRSPQAAELIRAVNASHYE